MDELSFRRAAGGSTPVRMLKRRAALSGLPAPDRGAACRSGTRHRFLDEDEAAMAARPPATFQAPPGVGHDRNQALPPRTCAMALVPGIGFG